MIILGNGRVGGGLVQQCIARGFGFHLVTREGGWDALDQPAGRPILVCTNADDIRSVVRSVPVNRKGDLVFLQNGMIGPVLEEVACPTNTLGLLYFAVPRRGEPIQPGGTSLFCGGHAVAVADWFNTVGLSARVVSRLEYMNEMASKLIWNCTFGLLCSVYDETVGALVETRRDEVEGLVEELCLVANRNLQTSLVSHEVSRELCEYSQSIASYKGALKQWEWRNGWFVEAARISGIATPRHADLLTRQTVLAI